MNDLIPLVLFIGCLFATFGLVRVCEWLRPASSAPQVVAGGADRSLPRHEESFR